MDIENPFEASWFAHKEIIPMEMIKHSRKMIPEFDNWALLMILLMFLASCGSSGEVATAANE